MAIKAGCLNSAEMCSERPLLSSFSTGNEGSPTGASQTDRDGKKERGRHLDDSLDLHCHRVEDMSECNVRFAKYKGFEKDMITALTSK